MSAETLHKKAMDRAEEAEYAKRQGNLPKYKALLVEAWQLESEAANNYLMKSEFEPTRSVLFRSAASMAVELNEWRSAEQLISAALFGNPPAEIAEELRDFSETVNFRRHLELRGLTLSESEFQMSLSGDGVGFGVALTNLFVERVTDVERLVKRTAERVMQRPFREQGRMKRSIQDDFSLFVSAPRPGSFAVTFQVGSNRQVSLPGEDMGGRVVNEVVDCLEILQDQGETGLTARIEDEAYRRNFLSLARKIAPDGKDVSSVGFTAQTKGHERKFSFTTSRNRIASISPQTLVAYEVSSPSKELVTVSGVLKFADARDESKGIIDLIDDQNHEHTVFVPSGMMSDIVKPMFGERVTIKGFRDKKGIILEDIDNASTDSGYKINN